jgi:malate dehydrogenase
MPFIAVIGAGPIGGALAQKLALRSRIAEVRLIDPFGSVAQGKALDILQSSPVERFATQVTAAQALHSAAGARAIAIADSAATSSEHAGETGLATLRELAGVERMSPIVFAGAAQRDLIGRAVSELHVRRSRVLGSAPGALESALRALAGLAIDGSGAEVQLRIAGVPPAEIAVGWEEATAFGSPLSSHMAPHVIAAMTQRIPGLWPPGPYALASAAARVIEAIADGSRKRFTCFIALESGAARHRVSAVPVELGPQGIMRVLEPSLTQHERIRAGLTSD